MSVRWWREKQQRFRSRCRWWRSELAPDFGQLCLLWTNPVSGQETPANIQRSECMWFISGIIFCTSHKHRPAGLQRTWGGCSRRSFPPMWCWRASSRKSSSLPRHLKAAKQMGICWHLRQSASELIPFGASCTHHSEWSPRMRRRLRSSPANREQIIRRQELSVLVF